MILGQNIFIQNIVKVISGTLMNFEQGPIDQKIMFSYSHLHFKNHHQTFVISYLSRFVNLE